MSTKLFIRNLSWSVVEGDLYALFGEVGQVVSVSLPMRREDGKPRGIAFIEMATPDAAQNAIKSLNGAMLHDRDIVVDFQNEERKSTGYNSPEKNNKLFIRGLSYSVTDQSLQRHLEQAGFVISAKVAMDRETDQSKGFGFVEMGSVEEAQSAIDSLNNSYLDGKEILISFSDPNRSKKPSFGNRGGGRSYGSGYDRQDRSGYSQRW